MAKTGFTSVDQYIASQPETSRPVLERVRTAIKKALPRAEEGISYQIPAYTLPSGRPVICFAGWKEHYAIYGATGEVVRAFKKDLAPYEIGKGTIQFPLSEPVPVKLIESIAKFRAKEDPVRPKPKKTAGKR